MTTTALTSSPLSDLRTAVRGPVLTADDPALPAEAATWNLAVAGRGTLRDGLEPFWRRLPALLGPAGRFVAITDATLDAPTALVRAGLALGLASRVRLAGRLSDGGGP